MYTIHKLKPDRNFYSLLLPFGLLVALALIVVLFNLQAAYLFFGAFFILYAVYNILAFARTRNPGFLVVACFQISGGLMAFSATALFRSKAYLPIPMFFLACVIFFLVWTIILLFNKKIKWRGREILEMAAASVDEVGNGYTNRPLPVGKVEFSPSQIQEFARFALRHLIAVPYVGKDKVGLVPVRMDQEIPYILGLKSDYTDLTWVAFHFDGNVTVKISHPDYLSYHEALSFNQLCEALGSLFIDFMDMYRRGEGERIIDRMDAVGISIFS
jgi:hypothetical protein